MGYPLALSRIMGEIESPTQTQGLQQPQFGGSPEQLMAMLQSPEIQKQFQHWGVQFDPSQMRQSPFLPNSFMQGHPQMGHMLTGMMANAAATPEAPLVSGAGSGISRAMQGMMGGPEMLRQYQIRQMMSPMQMIGAQMPMQEFQRKQGMLDLLTKWEQDKQLLAQQHQNWQQGQAVKTPYGLIMPGQQTPVPPEVQGQTPHSMHAQGWGADPLMGSMFKGQGQQPFQEQGPPTFQPYDPKMLEQQTKATHPERPAAAGLNKERVNTEKAKQSELGARSEKEKKQGAAAEKTAGKDYAKDYDAIEKDITPKIQALQRAMQGAKTPEEKAFFQSQIDDLNRNRETRKGTVDAQRGDPGASKRGDVIKDLKGLVGSGAGGQQGGGLQRDEAGNLWDMSNPNQPVYKGKAQ